MGGLLMSKNNCDFFKKKNPWSEIKDQLLGCYLVPYFAKIIGTRKKILYVDGFAGKGLFDDGNLGSPLIALRIIKNSLEKSRYDNISITACFIELNHTEALKDNICHYKDITIISGKYEDHIEKVLQGKQQQNVFLYIDPYGIKSLRFSVFDSLKSKQLNSVELLMNMNSFGFIREACNAMNVKFDIPDLEEIIGVCESSNIPDSKSVEDLNEVAGGVYWKKIIQDYKLKRIDGYEAEKRFTEEYCLNLRKVFKYVLNMPIRLKKGQRPKYRMIYATNHEQGCVLMNDNMCKRWEALEDIQNSGQISLFAQDVDNNVIDETQLYDLLIERIKGCCNFTNLNVFYANLFMDIGVKYASGDVAKQFKIIEKSNIIEVERFPKTSSTGKPTTFWTVQKRQTIRIRCVK